MGRRGPPPKPTLLKIAAGNPGRRPLPKNEPQPPKGDVEPPDFLDARALALWNAIVPTLGNVGLARPVDGGVLGRYCVMFVMWLSDAMFCRKNGTTYPVRAEPVGNQKQGRILHFREFPQAGSMRKLDKQLLAIEREFGLTPAARTRIRADNERAMDRDMPAHKRNFYLRKA